MPGKIQNPNHAAQDAEPAGQFAERGTAHRSVKTFAAAVAGVEVVPEFDVVFVGLPAKEDFAPADQGGEIDQAAGEVFDDDVAVLELGKDVLHAGEGANPVIDGVPTDILPCVIEAAEPAVVEFDLGAQAVEVGKPLAQLRQESTGLFPGIMLGKAVFHKKDVRGGCARQPPRTVEITGGGRDYFCQVRFL